MSLTNEVLVPGTLGGGDASTLDLPGWLLSRASPLMRSVSSSTSEDYEVLEEPSQKPGSSDLRSLTRPEPRLLGQLRFLGQEAAPDIP